MDYYLNENNNYKVTFDLVDESGDAISISVLDTLTCTMYYYNAELGTSDKWHLATINHRYNQDIKNVNGVTVSANCNCVWNMSSSDTVKLSNKEQELHVALIKWMWSTTKQNSFEFNFYIREVPYA